MTELSHLYDMAAGSEIDVDFIKGGSLASFSVLLHGGKCCIAMNAGCISSPREEKELLAHELGHCKTGAFYSEDSCRGSRERSEYRANRWMVTHLVPVQEFAELLKKEYSVEDLADHFQVSADLIVKAYLLYKDLGLL